MNLNPGGPDIEDGLLGVLGACGAPLESGSALMRAEVPGGGGGLLLSGCFPLPGALMAVKPLMFCAN